MLINLSYETGGFNTKRPAAIVYEPWVGNYGLSLISLLAAAGFAARAADKRWSEEKANEWAKGK